MAQADSKQLVWTELALMAFVSVWGFGNVVNNFAQQGLSVIFSWIFMMLFYFVPYALMVGELGAVYRNHKGGVASWIRHAPFKSERTGINLAYLAGWTYWVVHIPYLAQKPQAVIIAFGWAIRQNGSLMTEFSTAALQFTSLILFIGFMALAARGITSLKRIGAIAGTSVFVLSILWVLLALTAPAFRSVPIATQDIFNFKNFVPNFDLAYFTTLSMLVFAVGGAEKISPYVNNLKNANKGFPMAMIALAIMVAINALLGSFAMGMMFDANNRPPDLMMNGSYYAFRMLGDYYGVGSLFVIVFALSNLAAQVSAVMFSIDAPLKMMLLDADTRFVPKVLTKVNKHGAPINGYYLTLVLVAILIMVPVLGIGDMNNLFNWLLNLNSIVMPMRYMWVFFAYVMLRSILGDKQNTEPHYQFLKNRPVANIFGWWCFALTAFVCIMGAIPKKLEAGTAEYNFQLTLNILAPVIFIALGFILPLIAKKTNK